MIPFCKPSITETEQNYIREAADGRICGDGPFTERVLGLFSEKTGLSRVLMTTSCTHALELAAMLLDIKAGDEVILPSFTFSSTANAFLLQGATLRFCEINPFDMNVDVSHMESLINEKTRVLAPIDYAGVSCDMDVINRLAKKHSLFVVQDSAQAVGSRYKGRAVGADADFSCFSFHETKNYVMGEGGAIHIKDPALVNKAEILREKGTDRSRFYRGETDKYTWQGKGSSLLPSDILCAMLLGQLERFEEIKHKRLAVWNFFNDRLEELEDAGKLLRPGVPGYAEHNAHIFYLLLNSAAERDALLDFLRKKGVGAVFHYIPLHSAPNGLAMGNRPEDLPLTESCSARLLRLPLFPDMSEQERVHIVNSVLEFF